MSQSKPKITFKLKKSPIDTGDDQLIDLSITSNQIDEDQPNRLILELLSKLVIQITEQNRSEKEKKVKSQNQFRIKALKDAVQSIHDYPDKITSGYEAKALKGVGKGTAERIDEILSTGQLQELKATEPDEETKAIESLSQIVGIGEVHAMTYYNQNDIKSADELIKLWKTNKLPPEIKLTHQMEVGLKHYHDLQVKIPYDEVKLVRPILEETFKKVDPKLIYEICGSHRRQKAFSGDVDVLLTHPKYQTKEALEKAPKSYLNEIINQLNQQGFLIDYLTNEGHTKYMGVCRITDLARRIDIRMVPYQSWATALMYFTGSGAFNIKLRKVALKKGYTLTEYGIYKLEKGKKGPMVKKMKTEKDVFKFLGVKYLEPKEREM